MKQHVYNALRQIVDSEASTAFITLHISQEFNSDVGKIAKIKSTGIKLIKPQLLG